MPNFTIKKEDGSKVDVEVKDLAAAKVKAKKLGGEVLQKTGTKPKGLKDGE